MKIRKTTKATVLLEEETIRTTQRQGRVNVRSVKKRSVIFFWKNGGCFDEKLKISLEELDGQRATRQ